MSDQLIGAIRVVELFGLYTYDLPNKGAFSNAAILYGDNGVGKSTILRAAFHLLSASGKNGHRSALYKIIFRKLEIDLANNITLRAERDLEQSDGFLTLSIVSSGRVVAQWDYQPRSSVEARYLDEEGFVVIHDADGRPSIKRIKKPSRADSIKRGEKAYLEALASLAPNVFIVSADRRLDSDLVADPGDELELRKLLRFQETKNIYDLVARSREIALTQALSAAARWISRKALQGANQGSMNVHGVYVNVLRHLLKPIGTAEKPASNPSQLVKKLSSIEFRSGELARYEFATSISTLEFKKSLGARGIKKRELAADLLQPYIESLESRLNALADIYDVVDTFVSTVNEFLSDKRLIYKLTTGFSIENKLGSPLDAAQLSSGEQQLLLLFCYVLTSRDTPSVFMIDEPEISLNIKWQRQLIQSLLDITKGSNIQFIFASHSMELLTPHRDRVVRLVGA